MRTCVPAIAGEHAKGRRSKMSESWNCHWSLPAGAVSLSVKDAVPERCMFPWKVGQDSLPAGTCGAVARVSKGVNNHHPSQIATRVIVRKPPVLMGLVRVACHIRPAASRQASGLVSHRATKTNPSTTWGNTSIRVCIGPKSVGTTPRHPKPVKVPLRNTTYVSNKTPAGTMLPRSRNPHPLTAPVNSLSPGGLRAPAHAGNARCSSRAAHRVFHPRCQLWRCFQNHRSCGW